MNAIFPQSLKYTYGDIRNLSALNGILFQHPFGERALAAEITYFHSGEAGSAAGLLILIPKITPCNKYQKSSLELHALDQLKRRRPCMGQYPLFDDYAELSPLDLIGALFLHKIDTIVILNSQDMSPRDKDFLNLLLNNSYGLKMPLSIVLFSHDFFENIFSGTKANILSMLGNPREVPAVYTYEEAKIFIQNYDLALKDYIQIDDVFVQSVLERLGSPGCYPIIDVRDACAAKFNEIKRQFDTDWWLDNPPQDSAAA